MKHQHRFVEEQQTKHRFCGLCGKHDPPDPNCPDRASGLWAMVSDPKWRKLMKDPEEWLH